MHRQWRILQDFRAYQQPIGDTPSKLLIANAFVLAKMKIATKGRHLWTRTIGSTIFGQAVDSLLFYPLAFAGIWATHDVGKVLLTNWAMKVGWEVLLTPLTYAVVGYLKRREGVEVFDEGTKFSPFAKMRSI